MNRNECCRRHGMTVVELLVAIAIAGIISTLCFVVYGNTVRMFSRQRHAAVDLQSTIIVKKRIERACGKFKSVRHCTEWEISGSIYDNDSSLTLRFRDGVLFDNNKTVASGIKTFSFSLVENTGDPTDRTTVLLWEGIVAGSDHWVGGAVPVRKSVGK